jgi:hypothetical protein
MQETGHALEAGQVYTMVVIGTPGSTDHPLSLMSVFVPATS